MRKNYFNFWPLLLLVLLLFLLTPLPLSAAEWDLKYSQNFDAAPGPALEDGASIQKLDLSRTWVDVKPKLFGWPVDLDLGVYATLIQSEYEFTYETTESRGKWVTPQPQATSRCIKPPEPTPIFVSETFAKAHIGKEKNLTPGLGVRASFVWTIYKELDLTVSPGLLFLLDGGEVPGLADSWGYGTGDIDFSLYYFHAGYSHISAFDKHAKDGDYGANLLYAKFVIPFFTY